MSNANARERQTNEIWKNRAASLENAVDKVATNSSTSTEDGSVTKLLAELLAVLLEFAGSLAFTITHT